MWGPLLGLLVLVAVVAAAVRVRGPGSLPMRRAMMTVGGGIVAVFLLGVAAEGCAGPADHSAGNPVVQP
ncbi:hypothetical protein [Cryptosporangium minutisporangium]|uniref:Uncharacterized protein n=1 Tax=Cryptosporangium minutisporangium TaxID=113569 RepID=A0ABP6T6T1_9ACTN